MTESAAPLPSGPSPEALPSPSERPGVPCDRCGTFVQGAPEKIGPRRVCETDPPVGSTVDPGSSVTLKTAKRC